MIDDAAMRYVDGELDAVDVAAMEAAMAADPELRARVERERALRAALGKAFEEQLTEPVPTRLLAAVKPAGTVVELATARTRLSAPRGRVQGFVPSWGALAATLVLGLIAGRALPTAEVPMLAADPALERSLNGSVTKGIRIGFSYKDRAADYCRVFHDDRAVPAAGVACRRDGVGWAVQVIAATRPATPGDYRTAAADLPPAVLAAVDAGIVGSPLDAAEEAEVARRAWLQ